MPVSAQGNGTGAWRHLVDAFAGSIEEIGEEAVQRETSSLSSYANYTQQELYDVSCRGLNGLALVLRDRRAPSDDEHARYWATTDAQAKNGVVLEDMLEAWHVGLDVLRSWARTRVAVDDLPADVMVDFLDLTIPWMHSGSKVTMEYYRRAGAAGRTHAERTQRLFVRQVLSGSTAPPELASRCAAFGVDPAGRFFALRAPAADDRAFAAVRSWLGANPELTEGGMFARVGGDVWGFAPHPPAVEPDGAVGIAGPTVLDGLPGAFSRATRALATASSLGLAGARNLRSLGLHATILEEDEVGDGLVERYVLCVEALGPSGDDLLDTVRSYLSHQSQRDRVAAELYVHPNTVRYRLRRYEEITGATLRDTESLASVWWALERHRMTRPVED